MKRATLTGSGPPARRLRRRRVFWEPVFRAPGHGQALTGVRRRSGKELINQKAGMAPVSPVAGVDGENLHPWLNSQAPFETA